MASLKNLIVAFWTWRTHSLIPLAPAHFVPTPQQMRTLERLAIQKIHLTFRRNVGAVVARTYWATGEKDSFLPREIRFAPNQPFLLLRKQNGELEIRAGLAYHSLPADKFELFLGHVLACSEESIRFRDLFTTPPMPPVSPPGQDNHTMPPSSGEYFSRY